MQKNNINNIIKEELNNFLLNEKQKINGKNRFNNKSNFNKKITPNIPPKQTLQDKKNNRQPLQLGYSGDPKKIYSPYNNNGNNNIRLNNSWATSMPSRVNNGGVSKQQPRSGYQSNNTTNIQSGLTTRQANPQRIGQQSLEQPTVEYGNTSNNTKKTSLGQKLQANAEDAQFSEVGSNNTALAHSQTKFPVTTANASENNIVGNEDGKFESEEPTFDNINGNEITTPNDANLNGNGTNGTSSENNKKNPNFLDVRKYLNMEDEYPISMALDRLIKDRQIDAERGYQMMRELENIGW